MDFLRCLPTVFVIGEKYEILINVKSAGIIFVRVKGVCYYEETSGVLSSEKRYVKIRVPQVVLDKAKEYEIVYKETVERKAYYSKFEQEKLARFSFKPLTKRENINLYHIADVHYHFEWAGNVADYFQDNTDLFIINGDIGEVETEENYFEVCQFVGDISKGEIPVLFTRGNHDTRGKLAERYADYFPCENKDTFYSFSLGVLRGVVLDCGEDKPDENSEYGGVNVFSTYRQKERKFLDDLSIDDGEFTFAVSHICPVMCTDEKNSVFDIERECYSAWNRSLERLGIELMLCGHVHETYILHENDERGILPHKYPVIFGAGLSEEKGITGTAITLKEKEIEICFTDKNCKVIERHILSRNKKERDA